MPLIFMRELEQFLLCACVHFCIQVCLHVYIRAHGSQRKILSQTLFINFLILTAILRVLYCCCSVYKQAEIQNSEVQCYTQIDRAVLNLGVRLWNQF